MKTGLPQTEFESPDASEESDNAHMDTYTVPKS